jgi:hypothetical protein
LSSDPSVLGRRPATLTHVSLHPAPRGRQLIMSGVA